jgi:hypothetical protein
VFSGWFITIVILVSAVLMQGSRNGNDLWLSYWVDKTGKGVSHYSTSFYLVLNSRIKPRNVTLMSLCFSSLIITTNLADGSLYLLHH